jgi:hypothetical protein
MPNNVTTAELDPLKAQPFRTQRAELPEDLWQPLYDRVQYPLAGINALSFFSVARGQQANLIVGGAIVLKTKTYRDTNMENSNVVPTKMFKFVGISLGFVHLTEGAVTNPVDRDRLRSGAFLQFRIVDKDILFLPLVALPEVNPYIIAGAAATVGAAGGGGQNVPMYRLPIPITLNPYENFNVTISIDGVVALTGDVDVYVMLQGYMRRPT